jgi:intracellular septation protein A
MERKKVIRGIIFTLLINAALPFMIYQLLLGRMSSIKALTIATLIPLIETVIHFIKYKKWDVFAMFMLIGFILSILAALISGNERLILVRESFVTGIMGLIFLGSLATQRPLIYHFALQFTVGKTQEERAAFADNWNIPYVQKVLRILTIGWGIALLGEALLKVILVYNLSVSAFLAISSLVTYGTIGLAIAWTVVYRRKSREKLAELNINHVNP